MDSIKSALATRGPRNLAVYGLLALILIAVHYIIAFNEGATRSVAQAAVFSWAGLGIFLGLGLIGLFFLSLGRLPGLWDTQVGLDRKLWQPLGLGLAAGLLTLLIDQQTGLTKLIAAEMHLTSIHIDYPISIPIYFGGAILVTIAYYLVLLPTLHWIISDWLLKGRYEKSVFWCVALPLVLVEPLTQGQITAIEKWGIVGLLGLMMDLVLNVLQALYFRRGGLVAACIVRIGYYAFSHIVAGLIQ